MLDTVQGFDAIQDTRPAARHVTMKRLAIGLALLAGTAAVAWYGYDYWTTGQYLVSTDDAYVQADYTIVAPKVAGYITAEEVVDNQKVKAGQVLARIDDRDYQTALGQAQADVAAGDAAVGNLDAQVTLQQAIIDEAAAGVRATEAQLRFAVADAQRYKRLTTTGAGTIQRAEQTEAMQAQIAAQLQRDQAALRAAEGKTQVLVTARAQAAAQLQHAQAALRQARLNLSYTTITAPVDGTVGARTLRVGQYVTAGTQLMAVVPLHAVYIVANYKETQLAQVRPGQAVKISVDGLPSDDLRGHVDSLSPASGLEFALLPPDNATGNFTKIVQRIPVRIGLDDPARQSGLRAGMSVEPTIDTKPAD